jgi:hypothetical protein
MCMPTVHERRAAAIEAIAHALLELAAVASTPWPACQDCVHDQTGKGTPPHVHWFASE